MGLEQHERVKDDRFFFFFWVNYVFQELKAIYTANRSVINHRAESFITYINFLALHVGLQKRTKREGTR